MSKPAGIVVADSNGAAESALNRIVNGIFLNTTVQNFFGASSFKDGGSNPMLTPGRIVVSNNAKVGQEVNGSTYAAIRTKDILDHHVLNTGIGGDVNRGLVNIYTPGDDMDETTLSVATGVGVDGSTFTETVGYTMFHELFHGMSVPGMNRQTTVSDFAYQEQIAVFATNAVYAK